METDEKTLLALQAEVRETQRQMLFLTKIIIPAIIRAGTLTNDAVDVLGKEVMKMQGIELPERILQ